MGHMGHWKQAALMPMAPSYLFLIPSVQVPVQDHTGTLPLPDLQKHCGCGEHREVSQHTWGELRLAGPRTLQGCPAVTHPTEP